MKIVAVLAMMVNGSSKAGRSAHDATTGRVDNLRPSGYICDKESHSNKATKSHPDIDKNRNR